MFGELSSEFDNLSAFERTLVLKSIRELRKNGSSRTLDSLWEVDYLERPVGMEQFLSDDYYLGTLTEDLFPKLREELCLIFRPSSSVYEVILAGGIGYGKTTLAAIGLTYIIYLLSTLKNPHKFYHLMRGSDIVIGIYSTTKTQAYNTSYAKIRTFVDESPYFQQKFPRVVRIKSKIVFRRGGIQVISGSSQLHSIGLDMFGFLLDEANFIVAKSKKSGDGSDEATKIYLGAVVRMKSRFMTTGGKMPGICFLVSSKKTHRSFLEKHIEDSKKEIDSGSVHLIEYAQWEVRDPKRYRKPKFEIEIGDQVYPSRILKAGEAPRMGADIITVPGEYFKDFDADVDQALRDIAGVATYGISPLFHNRSVIMECENAESEHPFLREDIVLDENKEILIDQYFVPERMFRVVRSSYSPKHDPAAPRFIHIDHGLTGDCAGIACVHAAQFKKVRRARGDGTFYIDRCPKLVCDFVLRIRPPRDSEIDLSKIRSFIISLRDMGLPIIKVTFDGWQCFTANTRVSLLDGTEKSMKELASEFGRHTEFEVYSYDNKRGRVCRGVARNARKMGRKEVCEVHLDNGAIERCTVDHLWLLRDGEYCEAQNLNSGDSLMPLYRRVSERGRDSLDGYEMAKHPGKEKWQYTHRVVANEYRDMFEHRAVVHHRNFNKRDNRRDNLQWMQENDHISLHSEQGRKNSPFAREGYWTEERRREQSEMVKVLHENSEYRENAIKNLVPGQTSEKQRRKARERALSRNVGGEKHPGCLKHVTAELVIDMAILNPGASQREIGRMLGVSQDVVSLCLDECGIGKSRGWRNRLVRGNHKVVKVVFTGEVEDVYDIEVDEYHNFALSSGVFVHNSRDAMQIMRKLKFESNVYSVDRTDEAYLYLRQAIVEKRLSMYHYKPLQIELMELERDIDARKVDHPKVSNITGEKGSKDVADALCGAVAQCMMDPRVAVEIGPTISEDRESGGFDVQEVGSLAGRFDWDRVDEELKK